MNELKIQNFSMLLRFNVKATGSKIQDIPKLQNIYQLFQILTSANLAMILRHCSYEAGKTVTGHIKQHNINKL